MKIINLIPYGKNNATTRTRLCELTKLSDRKIRDLIADARRDNAIINTQDGKGYYRPLPSDIDAVRQYLSQEEHRAKSIFWAMKGAKEWLKQKDTIG